MNRNNIPMINYLHLFLAFVLIAGVSGCSGVKLVADYDEKTDKGVTELHKQILGGIL